MRRKKNRGEPGRTGTHPRGPDGKASTMLPETTIVELVGGPLDGLRLVLRDPGPEVLLSWVSQPLEKGGPSVVCPQVGYPGPIERYVRDRVSSEGSYAFFRHAGEVTS